MYYQQDRWMTNVAFSSIEDLESTELSRASERTTWALGKVQGPQQKGSMELRGSCRVPQCILRRCKWTMLALRGNWEMVLKTHQTCFVSPGHLLIYVPLSKSNEGRSALCNDDGFNYDRNLWVFEFKKSVPLSSLSFSFFHFVHLSFWNGANCLTGSLFLNRIPFSHVQFKSISTRQVTQILSARLQWVFSDHAVHKNLKTWNQPLSQRPCWKDDFRTKSFSEFLSEFLVLSKSRMFLFSADLTAPKRLLWHQYPCLTTWSTEADWEDLPKLLERSSVVQVSENSCDESSFLSSATAPNLLFWVHSEFTCALWNCKERNESVESIYSCLSQAVLNQESAALLHLHLSRSG